VGRIKVGCKRSYNGFSLAWYDALLEMLRRWVSSSIARLPSHPRSTLLVAKLRGLPLWGSLRACCLGGPPRSLEQGIEKEIQGQSGEFLPEGEDKWGWKAELARLWRGVMRS
jgi:hypothetical protein